MNDLIEKVKNGIKNCTDKKNKNPCESCEYRRKQGCTSYWMKDALSVIESLSSNDGAIEVLRSSGWMQNHDHEMTANGTLFMKWLSELMLNTDDEPIKPSEIIDRIDQGGFSRFVDDWKDGKQDV